MALRMGLRRIFAFFLVLSFFNAIVQSSASKQHPLSDPEYICAHPPYQIHILSTSPIVIYISNFITQSERIHLLSATEGTFANSAVADESGNQGLRETRTSKSTIVPRDPVVECIETRALLFQGLSISREQLEPLQLVQYSLNQSYHYHTDWFPLPNPSSNSPSPISPQFGGNRVSSFFAYISTSSDLIGGGTNFPLLDAPQGEEWCEYIDCDEEWENGVTFRPLEGNAVFWVNLKEDGEGDERVLHKGVMVERGGKVGMNIWTREGPLSKEVRGE